MYDLVTHVVTLTKIQPGFESLSDHSGRLFEKKKKSGIHTSSYGIHSSRPSEETYFCQ